jgi:hypothetical protein
MASKKQEVQETPQQAAMVERAQLQLKDYKTRWLPVQMQLSKTIQDMGAADSGERTRAADRSNTETEAKFAAARGAVEKSLTNQGAGAGSGRFNMAQSQLETDQATSTGLGGVAVDQAIDDAYTQGLGALTSLGQGQKADAMRGTTDIAATSARQAAVDAALSRAEAEGNAELAGQAIGVGIGSMKAKPAANAPAYASVNGPGAGDNSMYITPSFGRVR